MAIDTEAARLLLGMSTTGVSFTRTVMLGRQSLLLSDREILGLMRDFRLGEDKCRDVLAGSYPNRYSEAFFKLLGAKEIDSIDASDFEGATIVHDLNGPVPEAIRGRYDVVYDGGTIEHIFSSQTALQNCMDLAKVGGRVCLHTPANNYFEHDFYQFSPELFFRVFSESNGFEVERMVAVEYGPRRRWYQVIDPERARARGPLINPFPVLLFMQARKTAQVPLFRRVPQQSDYSALWAQHEQHPEDGAAGRPSALSRGILRVKSVLLERFPGLARALESLMFSQLNRGFSLRNRAAFVPIDKRAR